MLCCAVRVRPTQTPYVLGRRIGGPIVVARPSACTPTNLMVRRSLMRTSLPSYGCRTVWTADISGGVKRSLMRTSNPSDWCRATPELPTSSGGNSLPPC